MKAKYKRQIWEDQHGDRQQRIYRGVSDETTTKQTYYYEYRAGREGERKKRKEEREREGGVGGREGGREGEEGR